MNKNDKRLGRKMLAVYRDTDRAIEERAAQLGATCRKGCSDCCSLLISVTFPEAVAIAETLLTDPAHALRLKGLLPRLHAQIATIVEGIQRQEPGHYFRSAQPCVLLDPASKTCTVYAARPSTCRLHYVVTDPAWCSPHDTGGLVARVNMAEIGRAHINEACHAANQTQTPLWTGPLQIMLLWALKLLAEGREAVEQAHAQPEKLGALSLHLWRTRPPDASLGSTESASSSGSPDIADAGADSTVPSDL